MDNIKIMTMITGDILYKLRIRWGWESERIRYIAELDRRGYNIIPKSGVFKFTVTNKEGWYNGKQTT